MAYDPNKEQTIVISKEHHAMLKSMAEEQKRNLRTTTELVIEQAYESNSKNRK